MAGIHPLSEYRKARNMSREALGRELGVSGATVSRWERGRRKIDLGLLPKVSKATGIPKSELRPDLADAISEAAE